MKSELHFKTGKISEACALVRAYHYTKRPPANIQCVGSLHTDGGLFGDYGEIVAACFFSIPPTRWKEPVWELSRLVRAEEAQIQLTALICHTCKHIKRLGDIDLLVSYADSAQKHHGGIYQAASWYYHGITSKTMDGLFINGCFYPGRSCNSMYGTRSPILLAGKHPTWKIEPHYDEGKHLYWRALTRSGKAKAERLGLKRLDYPKPNKLS